MITLRCDGCTTDDESKTCTTCYYVVATEVFDSSNFKHMVCPITLLPTEWVEVEE